MPTTIGATSPRRFVTGIEAGALSQRAALVVCVGAGLAGALLDIGFRAPLHMPGWRGVASLALMVLARCVTRQPWAATATAATAAIVESALTATAPWAALFVLLHGVVLDGLCLGAPALRTHRLFIGITSGLANASTVFLMLLTGTPGQHQGGALAAGIAFPLLSHFVFGFCGGLIAAQLWNTGRSVFQSR
jgi:hypothetical protein